jgi:hypothetical protein
MKAHVQGSGLVALTSAASCLGQGTRHTACNTHSTDTDPHTHTHTHARARTHTHTHAHAHTHTNPHTHTHTRRRRCTTSACEAPSTSRACWMRWVPRCAWRSPMTARTPWCWAAWGTTRSTPQVCVRAARLCVCVRVCAPLAGVWWLQRCNSSPACAAPVLFVSVCSCACQLVFQHWSPHRRHATLHSRVLRALRCTACGGAGLAHQPV